MVNVLLTILVSTFVGYGFHRMMKVHMILNWYYQILKKASKWKLFSDYNKEYFGNKALEFTEISKSRILKFIVTTIAIPLHLIWYSLLTIIATLLYLLNKPLGKCMVCNTTWIAFIIAYHKGFTIPWVIIIGVASTGSIALLQLVKNLMKTHTADKYNRP